MPLPRRRPMSGSSALVAVNALLLKRTRLEGIAKPAPARDQAGQGSGLRPAPLSARLVTAGGLPIVHLCRTENLRR
jgi:hypothetical protein